MLYNKNNETNFTNTENQSPITATRRLYHTLRRYLNGTNGTTDTTAPAPDVIVTYKKFWKKRDRSSYIVRSKLKNNDNVVNFVTI